VNQQEIEQELVRGLAPIVAGRAPTLTAESTLTDLGIDSMGLIEIFIFIEKTFNLKLLESGIQREDLRSIRTLASYIASRIR